MKTSNIQTTHAPAIIKGWVRGISASSIADVAGLEWVVMTPTQLAANTNDWAPVDATDTTIDLDAASIIRASTSASWNLTGLTAPNPADEVLKVLENVGAFPLVLKHNVTSTAANRFLCPGDVDLTLPLDGAAYLLYDTVSARWRVTSGGGSGSGNIGGDIVPYYIPINQTYTVPLYKQALFNHAITVDGALVVNGILVGV